MRAADLVVVIPTRERWEILSRTIDGLAAQTAAGFETVISVDGTDQELPPWLRQRQDVRVLMGDHGGPGVARNRAVEESQQPLVLFLGDDMVPSPTLVARHLERHAQSPLPQVAVLGHVAWHPEVARNRVARWLDWSGSQFEYEALANQPGEEAGFGRFYSCNVSLKREMFIAAGGFDPDFVFDYEDLDLGWRLHEQGMRLLYEPAAVAHHLHRVRWERVEQRYASRARAERLMMAKHDWFAPWFHDRIVRSTSERQVSRLWPLIVDRVPPRPRRVRIWVRERADRWYHQRLAPAFLDAWEDSRIPG
jgi:GT2 family glycosyltransferase